MAALVRLVAFVVGAFGLEIWRGPGVLVLGGAAVLGFTRAAPLLVLVLGGACALGSLALPEAAGTGKVSHSLSNAPFVVVLYLVLAGAGYAGGRLIRRFTGRDDRVV